MNLLKFLIINIIKILKYLTKNNKISQDKISARFLSHQKFIMIKITKNIHILITIIMFNQICNHNSMPTPKNNNKIKFIHKVKLLINKSKSLISNQQIPFLLIIILTVTILMLRINNGLRLVINKQLNKA